MKAIELVETRQGCEIAERQPRFNVMFRGKLFNQLYFNLRGYVGLLPSPKADTDTPGNLTIGEVSIRAYRKEVAQLNKEWREKDQA